MPLFSVVHNSISSSLSLYNDLLTISQWIYQWKMIFNPDVSKQVQDVAFSLKEIDQAFRKKFQKHLGFFLDSNLKFSDHIKEKIKKTTKGTNVIRKMNLSLLRSFLLTIPK